MVGCPGRRVEPHTQCLAHLAPGHRAAYLAGLAPGSDLDHRGTTLDDALLTSLLDAVRDPVTGYSHLGTAHFVRSKFDADAWFGHATFTSDAWFDEAVFTGDAWFDGATFARTTSFYEATFSGTTGFDGATFTGEAWFTRATFTSTAGGFVGMYGGDVKFEGVTFANKAMFGDTTFAGEVTFDNATFASTSEFTLATFASDATFDNATFTGDARFGRATFGGDVGFHGARFAGDAGFALTTFAGTAGFLRAHFTRVAHLGPVVCTGNLVLSEAVFETAVTIEAAAQRLICVRTRWEQTAALRLRYAEVDLTDAVVTHPLAVAAHPVPFTTSLTAGPVPETGLSGPPAGRITSLQGVDVMHLVLTDADLTCCRFAGAFHLDQIRVAGRTKFAMPPAGIHRRGLVPVWWSRRRTLAEEHHWRALHDPPANPAVPTTREWAPGPHHPDADLTPEPDDVAPLYRALRKAFEDGKNEPGAADFYYGEMQMRRRDRVDTTRAERAILNVYWAVSGYGLRASRALGWLVVAMTATVLAMMLWGLPTHDPKPVMTGTQAAPGQPVRLTTDNPDPELHGSYASRVTGERAEKASRVVVNSVVFRSSGQNLTTAGAYIEMASRFTEPVLLALAALAVRGRIKR